MALHESVPPPVFVTVTVCGAGSTLSCVVKESVVAGKPDTRFLDVRQRHGSGLRGVDGVGTGYRHKALVLTIGQIDVGHRNGDPGGLPRPQGAGGRRDLEPPTVLRRGPVQNPSALVGDSEGLSPRGATFLQGEGHSGRRKPDHGSDPLELLGLDSVPSTGANLCRPLASEPHLSRRGKLDHHIQHLTGCLELHGDLYRDRLLLRTHRPGTFGDDPIPRPLDLDPPSVHLAQLIVGQFREACRHEEEGRVYPIQVQGVVGTTPDEDGPSCEESKNETARVERGGPMCDAVEVH